MSKRFKYLVSSLANTVGFVLLMSLPYESHFYGFLTGVVLCSFCFWFGLEMIFDRSMYVRLVVIILPVAFFLGFGLFMSLFPFNFWLVLVSSLFFVGVNYVLFLVNNLFLVVFKYKTVPLYRSAYTVSLIIMMFSAFLLFDGLFSFRWAYWINALSAGWVAWLMMVYHYWSIEVEIPRKSWSNVAIYTIIPAILVSEAALVFSFWPVGIFKASLYLVLIIYLICGLVQAELRGRLFKRTWISSLWMTVAFLIGILLITRWGDF